MASLQDKAFRARRIAREAGIAAMETVGRNAKTAKVSLTPLEEQKAAKRIKPTMEAERARTARRGAFIAKREAVKSSQKRIQVATGNVVKKAAAKKAVARKTATKKKSK